MSGHRLPFDLAKMPITVDDPGDGGQIAVSRWALVPLINSSGTGETRTVADPTAPFIVLVLMKNDGNSDNIVITFDSPFNAGSNQDTLTFNSQHDIAYMISKPYDSGSSSGYRWWRLAADGVSIS